jgi:hypothetical protein
MGSMKNHLMRIEELIYDALELGCRGADEIFSYVYMYEKCTDEDSVNLILDQIIDQLDDTDKLYYNSTFN